jgi:hypothetical protein
MISNFNKNHT